MSTEQNKALVRQFYEDLLNKHNPAAADELLTADHFSIVHGLPEPLRSAEAWKQVASAYFAAFPDLHTTIEDMLAEGDKVVVRYTVRGTHKGNFLGIPPTDRQFAASGIDIHQVTNGKIAAHWNNNNDLGMLQQLGVVPAMA